MTKGIVEEIFSKALYYNNREDYRVFYRNFERIIETSLLEFIKISDNFQTIPASRIEKITKKDTILFKKSENNF